MLFISKLMITVCKILSDLFSERKILSFDVIFFGILSQPSSIFVGDMFELGVENGRFYSLNVPLRDGIDDQGRL